MSFIPIGHGVSFPESYWTCQNQGLFPGPLIRLIARLHRKLNPSRLQLLERRRERQLDYDAGKLPTFLDRESEMVTGSWKVHPIPAELKQRRVEITGPVNSTKMVINMLSRNEQGDRADMAMLDFEDSMKPEFSHVIQGYHNVLGAVRGDLSESTPKKIYRLDPDDMAYVMVRVRGLHLEESNILVDETPISAGLLDLVTCFYHTAQLYLDKNQTPKYYVPKCEHHLEARWWNELFLHVQEAMNIPGGTLKATFLIETLPATFQVEEILYEIREHAAGLNVGRWDKIFSDIKVLKKHSDRIMGDRSTITMTKYWMENYAKRVIKICHSRGAFAMGGMSAFTPGKTPELREEQKRKVEEDKKREASWGHDGCWVSHPFFIGPAMRAFERENQLDRTLPEFDKYSDLLPSGEGPYTIEGLRTNIQVGIAYMHGRNQDLGCVAFNNLMEDLATLEISRAQVWQWIHHEVCLEDGTKVSKSLVRRLFIEEEAKLYRMFLEEMPGQDPDRLETELKQAALEACDLFLQDSLSDFLTLASPPVEQINKDVEYGKKSNGPGSGPDLANQRSMEGSDQGLSGR